MNIKKVRRPTYEALCMKCWRPGPPAFSPEEAELDAKKQGWRDLSYFNGFRQVEITHCPECYAERQLEGDK